MSLTRTTTRPIEQATCRTLVEHFELDTPEDNPDLEQAVREPEVKTEPLPVITQYDEGQIKKFDDIQAEVTRLLSRVLLIKRLASWLFFLKGRHTETVSVDSYQFDMIRDKVSCSATRALIADEKLLRTLLEAAAKNACDNVTGVKFVRFAPYKDLNDKPIATRSSMFVLEYNLA